MANLRSLQSEADNLEQRAQGAQQDAQRIRAESARQSAGGNPGKLVSRGNGNEQRARSS